MPPLAPAINPLLPTTGDPVPIGTAVAQIVLAPSEVDPGPFTYAKTQDPGVAYTLVADTLEAAIILDGAYFVAVTVTGASGTSPEGSATLVFSDDQNHWNDTPDPYEGNAQLPPPIPEADKWKFFIKAAIRDLVPRSRFGVDYMVAREAGKASGQVVLDWNDVLLGPYPQIEVETHAQDLAARWPWSEPLPP